MGRRLAGLLLTGSMLSVVAAEAATVERIRFVGTPSYGRIVIDVSALAEFSVFEIEGDAARDLPPRLVVDLASSSIAPESQAPMTVEGSLVARVRAGQFQRTTARVVLDLARPVSHRVFTLRDPFRVVVDLRAGDSGPGASGRSVVRLDSTTTKSTPAERTAPAAPPATAAARPEISRRPGTIRVMIDPGHGGKDPGAQHGGAAEKDVVLTVSRLLEARLRADPSIEVALTRSDDQTLSLEERTALANAYGADLFVSVHANASPRRGTRGIEVYYLNNTNNRGTLRLAAMENGLPWDPGDPSLGDAIPDLSYILSDLRQTFKVEESKLLAEEVGAGLVSHLAPRWEGTQNLGAKQGPFYVLVGAHMPCVLVEVGFLTNPVEGARLRSERYRREVAEGIYAGIRRYLAEQRVARNL